MITAPCKDCLDRCVGCHSKCEKYIEYDIQNKKRREAEAKRKAAEREYDAAQWKRFYKYR